MKAQIKRLSETDLNAVEQSWRTFDNALVKAQAEFHTKKPERVICANCGYRVELDEFCRVCKSRITPF